MRRSWVLSAALAMGMTVGIAAEMRPPDPAQQEHYVVASAEESRTLVARVPVASHQEVNPRVSGTLPLLLVGSMLLGLGAAVRRTT